MRAIFREDMDMEQLKPISIEELRSIKTTEVVNLGPFLGGVNLVAEVKRPDLLELVTSGKMPNTVLKAAIGMFNGNNKDTAEMMFKANEGDLTALKNLTGLLDVLVKNCLVSPSLEDIKSCGLELNMEQKMNILMYTQGGVKQLEDFRNQQANLKSPEAISEVQPIAEPDSEN